MTRTTMLFLAIIAINCQAQVFDRGLTSPPAAPLGAGQSTVKNPAWTDSRIPTQPLVGQPLRFNLPAPGPIIRSVSLMPTKPRLVIAKSAELKAKVAAFTARRHLLLEDIRNARTRNDSLTVARSVAALSLLHMERILWLREVAERVLPEKPNLGLDELIPAENAAPKLVVPKLPASGR